MSQNNLITILTNANFYIFFLLHRKEIFVGNLEKNEWINIIHDKSKMTYVTSIQMSLRNKDAFSLLYYFAISYRIRMSYNGISK